MGYKLLGFVVWRGARWYVRRRVGHLVTPRRMLTAALVVSVVGAGAAAAAHRGSGSDG